MPNSEPPPLTDPETWARRFDELVRLVKHNAEVARTSAIDAATNAAIKVTAENARAHEEIKRELLVRQDGDRKRQDDDRERQDVLHKKVDSLGEQMNDVLTTLNKLSTAKLTQIGITALILAALVIIGIKALGG